MAWTNKMNSTDAVFVFVCLTVVALIVIINKLFYILEHLIVDNGAKKNDSSRTQDEVLQDRRTSRQSDRDSCHTEEDRYQNRW